ncbi:PREDICTED: alsin-like isoform X3 [Ipomoea nil]|uniref:alsin-like isoform X3 n=1 Tax=Ipomoea nil TaxID=35883 RepID=UPI0009016ADF|nr:PREDICTED: alsin-like isoform X3 [Ipomoea nil]
MASRSAVIAWGSGEDGQLGIGDDEEKEWVCSIKALQNEKVSSVVAGSRNSLAICENGQLFTWGWNQRGTLGHAPISKTENIPSQVKALANVKIVQAAIGGWHCLAVDDQGRAYAWGGNEYGQCGEEPERKDDTGKPVRRDIGTPQRCVPKLSVRQVAAGGTHSVVLTKEGHVWTWGQPWPPGDIKQISTPVRVQGLASVRLIAVGAFHNLALLDDGALMAWGNNEYGQLGTGDTQPRSQPIPVQGLLGLSLVDIAAGGWHSAALTEEGEEPWMLWYLKGSYQLQCSPYSRFMVGAEGNMEGSALGMIRAVKWCHKRFNFYLGRILYRSRVEGPTLWH